MSESRALTSVNEAEYEAIEAAVMETARGRWFLAEYASRNRNADTKVLLDAIGRLEQAVTGEHAAQSLDRVRFDLMEMAKAISRTKTEIAALHPADHPHSHLVVASEALDAITRTTERATSEILEAAEHVQETAWTLREGDADAALCDELDRRATEIYTACSFQDLTAQRMTKIVQTLRYLEGRINAMIDIWGGEGVADEPASAAPMAAAQDAVDGIELTQSDVDVVIVEQDLFAVPEEPESAFDWADEALEEGDDQAFVEAKAAELIDQMMNHVQAVVDEAEPEPAAMGPNLAAFAEIDALDTREKLRRFS